MNNETAVTPQPPPRKTKGRTSGSEKRRMQPRLYVRVDEPLKIKADMDAAALGLTVGGYLRHLLADHCSIRSQRRPLPSDVLLRQIKAQAGHALGELSQLTKKVNVGAIPRPDHLDDAIRAVENFYDYALQALRDAR